MGDSFFHFHFHFEKKPRSEKELAIEVQSRDYFMQHCSRNVSSEDERHINALMLEREKLIEQRMDSEISGYLEEKKKEAPYGRQVEHTFDSERCDELRGCWRSKR